jgi:hypothetical protein
MAIFKINIGSKEHPHIIYMTEESYNELNRLVSEEIKSKGIVVLDQKTRGFYKKRMKDISLGQIEDAVRDVLFKDKPNS